VVAGRHLLFARWHDLRSEPNKDAPSSWRWGILFTRLHGKGGGSCTHRCDSNGRRSSKQHHIEAKDFATLEQNTFYFDEKRPERAGSSIGILPTALMRTREKPTPILPHGRRGRGEGLSCTRMVLAYHHIVQFHRFRPVLSAMPSTRVIYISHSAAGVTGSLLLPRLAAVEPGLFIAVAMADGRVSSQDGPIGENGENDQEWSTPGGG